MSFRSAATLLLVPPANLLLLAIVGFLLPRRWRGAGRWLTGIGLAGLLVLAMPAVPGVLYALLEDLPPPVAGQAAGLPPPAAIVILGGDVTRVGGAAPYTDIAALTLERLRAGAALYRTTHLPVLTSGGLVGRHGPPVARLMAQSLAQDFSVPTRWVEDGSASTWANAERSAAILQADGITSVFLVTHAWHMRRALLAFAATGLAVTPAPTPPEATGLSWGDFIPRASAWQRSYYALHEWIGCAWYALRRRA